MRPTKAEYTDMAMKLIYFNEKVKKYWPLCDLKILEELIEIVRFWRQFEE